MSWRESATFGTMKCRNARTLFPEFTINAESSENIINVEVQLNDHEGKAQAEPRVLLALLSSSATTNALSTDYVGAAAIGTNGILLNNESTSASRMLVSTDASGQFDLNLTKTGEATYYLTLVDPGDGHVEKSGAITFAA